MGGSNQQITLAMETMLEYQSHIIADLRADRDTHTLPPPPPPVLQAPHNPLQHLLGFNQRQ